MSGVYGGLQTLIKEHAPNADYVHCAPHGLNLVLNDAARHVREVSTFLDNLEKIYTFLYIVYNGDVAQEPVPCCDVIRITGKADNCQAAKKALLDLEPVTIAVDVPFGLHRSIIGQKGRNVKDLMDRFDVHIVLSALNAREDAIKITGAKANVERAREALLER
nr:unnamed protein product [Callosobruchus analis]